MVSCMWIKASGKWMADAIREDILMPLDLADVRERVAMAQKVDPAYRYCGASIETAMYTRFCRTGRSLFTYIA